MLLHHGSATGWRGGAAGRALRVEKDRAACCPSVLVPERGPGPGSINGTHEPCTRHGLFFSYHAHTIFCWFNFMSLLINNYLITHRSGPVPPRRRSPSPAAVPAVFIKRRSILGSVLFFYRRARSFPSSGRARGDVCARINCLASSKRFRSRGRSQNGAKVRRLHFYVCVPRPSTQTEHVTSTMRYALNIRAKKSIYSCCMQ